LPPEFSVIIFQLQELVGLEWQGDCELLFWNKVIMVQFKVPWNAKLKLLHYCIQCTT